MNVVDSSGWLEYFAAGPNADFFTPAIEAVDALLVPTVSLYEVFKHFLRERGEDAALQVLAALHQGKVVELDAALAAQAARLSLSERLPMADSVILATARAHGATLWTQDADFEDKAGVKYRRRRN